MRIVQFSPPNFFHFQSSVFKLGFHHLANVQFSIFNFQFSIFNFQFSIFNFQFSIFNSNPTQPNPIRSSGFPSHVSCPQSRAWHLTLNLSFFLRLVGPVSGKHPDSGYEKRVIDPSSVGRPNFLRNSRYPAVSAAEKADTSFSSFSW